MPMLFYVLCGFGLAFGLCLIIALLVRHSEANAIDARYQATYETTKALIEAMNKPREAGR